MFVLNTYADKYRTLIITALKTGTRFQLEMYPLIIFSTFPWFFSIKLRGILSRCRQVSRSNAVFRKLWAAFSKKKNWQTISAATPNKICYLQCPEKQTRSSRTFEFKSQEHTSPSFKRSTTLCHNICSVH